MPDFKEILTQNADAFKDIAGVDTTIETVSAKLKELGYGLIIDSQKEPGFVSKNRLDEVIAQRNTYKTDSETYMTQLEELKKGAKGNEELTKQIEALQNQVTDAQGKNKDLLLSSEIKLAAMKMSANDPDDVLAFIDKSKIELKEDGSIKGLEEQINALKEAKPYLFVAAPPNPNLPGNPNGGGKPNTVNPWKKETFNLTQQAKMLKENPTLAAQLKAAAK